LESLRVSRRNGAATLIQTAYRAWFCRRRWPVVRQTIQDRFPQLGKSREGAPEQRLNPVSSFMSTELQTGVSSSEEVRAHFQSNPQENFHNFSTDNNNYKNQARGGGSSYKSGTEHGMLQQAFPVPAQRTCSAAVISSTTLPPPPAATSATLHPNLNNPHRSNYKNIPPSGKASAGSIPAVHQEVPNGTLVKSSSEGMSSRPRPQPITGTPPPESPSQDGPGVKLVQEISSLYAFDLVIYSKVLKLITSRLFISLYEFPGEASDSSAQPSLHDQWNAQIRFPANASHRQEFPR